ncbi:vitamin K epoxide reductase family protein [Mucilaginibacter sp. BT774]|uniref:vitamin K epoxide reductase family protein n=1 Tax=Mucilaginibacter sp. BT774 TaxID=3062276 RepID=UPI002674FB30|nr:vitamin K epoxide reductase family protein [Mucilaginibacter sp. BT774]MDO3627472.1 vitamin K epoxide reductase family protein [Mucilaginibacter sp. BT774]
MFNLIERLFYPKSNGPETVKLLTDILQVKITQTTLTNELETHPDYPSLLSISDVLNNYGIENVAIQLDPSRLAEAPTPFITTIKNENDSAELCTVVKEIAKNTVLFFDPVKHLWTTVSREAFLSMLSGPILLVEADEGAGEKDYHENATQERKRRITLQLSLFFLPGVALGSGVLALMQNGVTSFLPFLFLMLTIVGVLLGVVLIWHEVDQHNPVLSQICKAGKKINCNAILHSKAAKIAGISWSAIGLSYFIGQLLLLMFTGITNANTLFALSWISVIALPYIFYSLYYQYSIAKQWCVLCLCVQGVLLLQFLTVLAAGGLTPLSSLLHNLSWALTILIAFISPLIATVWLMPVILRAKESKSSQNKLQQLKHNPQIFESLLARQKAVTESTEGLGITLGNPAAKYKLIKVCNPYCGPCAKAHRPIEELLANNPDVQVQIIFTSTNKDGDYRTPPVKHLMAIAEQNDTGLTKQALDDWYLAEKTDYTVFAAKYPVNGALNRQDAQIEAMSNWCNKTGISFTPTFFVSLQPVKNGESQTMEEEFYQLPEIYSVTDLKYFLSY